MNVSRLLDLALLEMSNSRPGPRAPLGTDPHSPGWVTDGRFALWVDHEIPGSAPWWKDKPGVLQELVERVSRATRHSVAEDLAKRTAMSLDLCRGCDGGGRRGDLAFDAEGLGPMSTLCRVCSGSGRMWTYGKRCYSGSGVDTWITDWYGLLLDGLTIFRADGVATKDDTDSPALVGYEADRVVAIVMPIKVPEQETA